MSEAGAAADRPVTAAELGELRDEIAAARAELAEVRLLLRATLNKRPKRLDPTPTSAARAGMLTDEQLAEARRAITAPKRKRRRSP